MTALTSPENCPDCQGKLGTGATKCRCGWKLTAEGLVPAVKALPCELKHMCDQPAKIAVLVDDKKLNACMACYHRHKDAELLASDRGRSAADRKANRDRISKILWAGSR